MIRLIIYQGNEDKLAPVITDDMIPDLISCYIRGQQELTSQRAIFRNRSLEIPHDPNMEIGNLKEVVIPHMGIFGTNEVTGSTIAIAEKGLVSHSLETRQIGGLTP